MLHLGHDDREHCIGGGIKMNRKEYSLVSRRSTDFGVEVSSIIDSFSRFVDGVKEKEEMKLDSLPESLEGSPLWSSIEEAIGMLEDVQDALEEMNGSLESIMSAMGTTA